MGTETEPRTQRTDSEILARIAEIKERDWMGFERHDLVDSLSFEAAKPFLSGDAIEEKWLQQGPDAIIVRMREYMPFAWDKANNCRGLSASRSMDHFSAWVWLLGDDFGNLGNYEYYGKDNLVRICQHYGWNHTQWDDNRRVNDDSDTGGGLPGQTMRKGER